MKTKQDIFTVIGGRVKFHRGLYNLTSDAVWLGAFTGPGRTVLDVGIGTGGVSLCMLAHNPDYEITGLDISEKMLGECTKNAALNERSIELIKSDIFSWKTDRTFDIVVTNPPYFKGTPRAGSEAHHNVNIYEWTLASLRRLKPRGYFYTIVDAGVMHEVVSALYAGKAGDIEILPLAGIYKCSPSLPEPPPGRAIKAPSAPPLEGGESCLRSGAQLSGSDTPALDSPPSRGGRTALLLRGRGGGSIAERVLVSARLNAKGRTKIYDQLPMNFEPVLRDGLTIQQVFTMLTTLC